MRTTSVTAPPTAAREWDEIRVAFASSLMADTALSSLAQNLDGLHWPIEGAAETPAAYIDLTYHELCSQLLGRGQPDAAALLTRILRETLEFDKPFGDMANQVEAGLPTENPLLRALARLNIPEEFPLTLTILDSSARELCRLEHIRTLGHFALFAQGLSQTVIVGGDFKRLLNALAYVDEVAIAQMVPFRPGSTGLHLPEALAQAPASENPAEHVARTVAWFGMEFAEWRQEAAKNRHFLPRQLTILNDVEKERLVLNLLSPHLGQPAVTKRADPRSFVSRWLKW